MMKNIFLRITHNALRRVMFVVLCLLCFGCTSEEDSQPANGSSTDTSLSTYEEEHWQW